MGKLSTDTHPPGQAACRDQGLGRSVPAGQAGSAMSPPPFTRAPNTWEGSLN